MQKRRRQRRCRRYVCSPSLIIVLSSIEKCLLRLYLYLFICAWFFSSAFPSSQIREGLSISSSRVSSLSFFFLFFFLFAFVSQEICSMLLERRGAMPSWENISTISPLRKSRSRISSHRYHVSTLFWQQNKTHGPILTNVDTFRCDAECYFLSGRKFIPPYRYRSNFTIISMKCERSSQDLGYGFCVVRAIYLFKIILVFCVPLRW